MDRIAITKNYHNVRSNRLHLFIAVFLSLSTMFTLGSPVSAGPDAPSATPPIIAGSEIGYPPFSIVDEDGRASGFSVELLRAALASMGREVSFRTGPWSEVRRWLEKGKVQALPLVGRNPEREGLFDFTFPYMSRRGAIVVREDTTDIRDLNDLKGRNVVVMKGDSTEEFLRRKDRGIDIRTTATFEDALRELSDGRHDAVVIQHLVALRLIQETGIANLRIIDKPIEGFSQDFCFAVKEGDRETLALLNEGLAVVMADGTYQHLHAKWFATLELPTQRHIIIGGDHNYPPFEFLDEKGRPAGYNVDLTRAMAYELDLDIEIRLGPWAEIREALANGEIDALQGMFYSPERDLIFDFTSPHMVNLCVSVVRKGEAPPPKTLDELAGKRIVVQNGDIMHDFAVENGLGNQVSVVDAQEGALRELAQGKHDCALVSRLTALYWIKKNNWKNLTVSRHALLAPKYCYVVPKNHKAMLAQLGEGLKLIDENGEYHRIQEKWMGVYDEPTPGFMTIFRYMAIIFFPLVALLLTFFLWSWSLRKQVARRTKELRESESQYRLLADNTLDMIWDMNLDLEFTYVNPACLDLTGYKPEEWVGTRLKDHCDKENYAKMAELVDRGMATTEEDPGIIVEFEIFNRNHERIPVEVHAKIIKDANGQSVRIQGTAHNISQRKQTEATLRKQARLLREMGVLAKIGGWEFDPDTGKGTWTDEVARIHDLDPGDEITMERGLSFYRAGSRQKIENAVKDAIELAKPYDLELELDTAKGVRKWIRTIGQPKTANGKTVNVRGSFQDITERKIFEQRIEHLNQVLRAVRDVGQLIVHERDPEVLIREGCRLIVENRGYASALIVLTDEKHRPVSWSKQGAGALSESLNSILQLGTLPPCCDHAHQDRPAVSITDRHRLCGNCPAWSEEGCAETQLLCAPIAHNGIIFGCLVATMGQDLSVDDEELSLFAEIAGDLAYTLYTIKGEQKHKQSEAERMSLEKQLQQAQKMESVGRLAGGVAHDFNNMLSVIIGYSELGLETVKKEDPLHNDLKEIYDAAKRASQVTRQLLAFSRRQTIAPIVLDLNQTVENILKMLRRLIGEDINLSWNPGAGLRPVKMDPTQVDQLLANLCVNARDAINGVGKIIIETDTKVFDEAYCAVHAGFIPGNFVMLAVSDDGCGMDSETQENIFEPFFTTKDTGKGTGLGLSTVYGIVKQNNGFINVYSEPGKGTTFRIYLPVSEGRDLETQMQRTEEIPTGNGETVIVVEDESLILDLAEKMLTSLNYHVLLAPSPDAALRLAEENEGRISLILTDVVMPEMSGRKLAERLRSIYPEIKCLFMSGYTANVIAHQGVLEKGVNFLQKPFSRRDLAIKVKGALESK